MTEAAEYKDKGGGEGALIETARKRLKQAIEAFQVSREQQVDDVKFTAGNPDNQWQWPEDVRNLRQGRNSITPARPTLTINKLPQHIRLVTNEQRQNRPTVKVLPVDDQGDIEVAEIFNGIIRHIEVNSDADIAFDTACENQVTHGEGYFRILTDYVDEMSFDQDILIAPIRNSFTVYMDPEGLRRDSTGRYCNWAFITDTLSEDEFKRQFPDAEPIDWDLVGRGDEYAEWFGEKKVVIAEYFHYEDQTKNLILWQDGQVTVEGDPIPPERSVLEQVKKRTTTVRIVKWCKLNGQEVLEEREWPGKYLPVVRVAGNEYEVDGEILVSGLVRNAKDAQRMVNYWKSQEAEMLALAPKAPFIGAVGQFEGREDMWQSANVSNFAYLEYNPIDINGQALPAPQRQMPPLPPAGVVQAALGASDDLQSTVGQYNPSLGAEAQEKSGRAILARQRQADVGTYHYIDNLSRAIRQCGRILIDLIPKIYDTQRIARILGEDGESDRVMLDPDMPVAKAEIQKENGEIQKIYNPTVGKYDVTVTVGPSYTTKRQEAAEGMTQLVSAMPQLMGVIGDVLVKNLDWPGAEEISERIKKTIDPKLLEDGQGDQKDQVIAQQQQQMQQLLQALESMQQSLEAQKVQIEQFNAETKRMEAVSKDKERQFNAATAYVDRTPVEDSQLLYPGYTL